MSSSLIIKSVNDHHRYISHKKSTVGHKPFPKDLQSLRLEPRASGFNQPAGTKKLQVGTTSLNTIVKHLTQNVTSM